MNGAQVGQQTASSQHRCNFAVPGQLADGQYIFTATAGTVSGLVSPFSTPLTITVDNTPPAISSFTLGFRFRRTAVRPEHDRDADRTPRWADGTRRDGRVGRDRAQRRRPIPRAISRSIRSTCRTIAAYTFTAKVTDVAGNVSTLAKTFTRIDNTLPSNLIPPDVTLNVSETTARIGDTVNISVVTATHDSKPLASEVAADQRQPGCDQLRPGRRRFRPWRRAYSRLWQTRLTQKGTRVMRRRRSSS